MKRFGLLALLCGIALFTIGCSTSAKVRAPEGSKLYINNAPVTVDDGWIDTRPYHWSAASGIPYRLEKDGKVLQEGTLSPKFRVASIFWPPAAILYWPIGFQSDAAYDLTKPNAEGGAAAIAK